MIEKKIKSLISVLRLCAVTAIMAFVMLAPRQADASCPCCPGYIACVVCTAVTETVIEVWWDQVTIPRINDFVDDQFEEHREWLEDDFWDGLMLPALRAMADQLTAVATQQTMIIGSFMDAKHQMETQRVLQTIRARAHKDYHPSNGVCEFGTSVRSLAASERQAELNAHIMAQRSQDRQLGNANTSASKGPAQDYDSRLLQYKEKFCDPSDHDGKIAGLCTHPGGVGATDPERVNKDIDYARTLDSKWTLNVDFTDNVLTEEEEEILALSSNIYGQKVFQRLSRDFIKKGAEADNLNATARTYTANRGNYMDARALMAKLSVAENSFNSISSMKSAGTAGSRDFLEAILEELGVSNGASGGSDDILRLLGMDDSNNEIGPSYHAQMEILTKKIYQNPDFYTNLYDKPINVERKKVAMQAIGLMQKFDLFKSYLRNEANTSILLELALEDLQGQVENELNE